MRPLMPRRRRRASRSRHALWRWPVAAFRRSPFAPWLAGLGLMLLGVATPALADAVRSLDPSVRLGSPAPLTEAQRAFIKEVGSVARSQRWQVGLPPSLVTAMAINETGWGQSGLTRRARNYFGIKADSGDGSAGSVLE